jgi:protein-disulfide isomerase
MTNKSSIKKFIKKITKHSTVNNLLSIKSTAIVILLTLVIAGVYFSTNKSPSDKNDIKTFNKTGLHLDQKVKNIGDVEKVIAKWVESNPKAILESVIAMQKKASEDQQVDAQQNISSRKNDLFNDKNSPTYSPKGYDVELVEFFDYNCGYCKKAELSLDAIIKEDKKVKIIFKELPILGASSAELSRVALAVNIMDSNNYLKFHSALMKSNAKNAVEAIKIAKELGINEDELQKTLKNKQSIIEEQIKANQELAASIGINGTPAFVIGKDLIPGAVSVKNLKERISAQRNK